MSKDAKQATQPRSLAHYYRDARTTLRAARKCATTALAPGLGGAPSLSTARSHLSLASEQLKKAVSKMEAVREVEQSASVIGPLLGEVVEAALIVQLTKASEDLFSSLLSLLDASNNGKTTKLNAHAIGVVWEACKNVKLLAQSNCGACSRAMLQAVKQLQDVRQEICALEFDSAAAAATAAAAAADKPAGDMKKEAADDDEDEIWGEEEPLSAEEWVVVPSCQVLVKTASLLARKCASFVSKADKEGALQESKAGDRDWIEALLRSVNSLCPLADQLGGSIYPPQDADALIAAFARIFSCLCSIHARLAALPQGCRVLALTFSAGDQKKLAADSALLTADEALGKLVADFAARATITATTGTGGAGGGISAASASADSKSDGANAVKSKECPVCLNLMLPLSPSADAGDTEMHTIGAVWLTKVAQSLHRAHSLPGCPLRSESESAASPKPPEA